MKNSTTLGPNWFLTHSPAPGSDCGYTGLGREGLQELSEMSRTPLTHAARLEAQDGAAQRQQRAYERSMR